MGVLMLHINEDIAKFSEMLQAIGIPEDELEKQCRVHLQPGIDY